MKKELILEIRKDQNPYYRDNSEFFDKLLDLVRAYPLSYFKMLRRDGIFYTSNGKLRYQKYNPDRDRRQLLNWIESSVPKLNDDFYALSTKCYWILNGLTDFPICQNCKKQEKYQRKNVHIFNGYPKFCCVSCTSSSAETQNKAKITCLEKYGVDNYSKTEEFEKRIRKTKFDAYGDKSFVNSEKMKHTKLMHNCGTYESEETKNLRKALSMRKYGVDNPSKSEQIRKKLISTSANFFRSLSK